MKHIPNILTILRLFACPLLIYLFYSNVHIFENKNITLIALIIFLFACITDFFDGYLARKKKLESNLGKILDPIADKALIITISILLIIYGIGLPKTPFLIIILREIIVLSLRYDLSNADKSINVNLLSKFITVIQMKAITSVFIYYIYDKGKYSYFFENTSIWLLWFASIVTIFSGLQHYRTYLNLRKNDTTN